MLVLGCKLNESVIIGGNIKVTVGGICSRSGQVKLVFDAPREVVIDREKIHFKKMQSKVGQVV